MAVALTDMSIRLSTTAGSAGDSLASTPAASLGKYLSQTAIVDNALGNLFDPVTGAEAEAGRVEYRCLFVVNNHVTDPLSSVKVWIAAQETGGADVAIGLDPAGVTAKGSASAQAATIPDEASAPAGVTFSLPTTAAAGLNAGTVAAGQAFAVWIRRKVPAGATAHASDGLLLGLSAEQAPPVYSAVSTAAQNSGTSLTFPHTAPGAVAGTHTSSTNSGSGSLSYAHTVAAGTDVLAVSVETRNGPVTGVTYGGVAMVRAERSLSSDREASIWYLSTPRAGTANVVVSLTASASGCISGATNLTGVDRANPVRASSTTNGATSVTAIVTSALGDIVIDALAGPDNGTGTTPTIGGGQTQLHGPAIISDTRGRSSWKPGAATSTTMGWTTLRSEDWRYVAVAFRVSAERLLAVAISYRAHNTPAATASSVTYNGVAMAKAYRQPNTDRNVEIWTLVGPAGGTNDVVITWSANPEDQVAAAISFTGVNATSPIASTSGAAASSTSPSVTAFALASQLILAAAATYPNGIANWPATPGAGTTERWELEPAARNISGFGGHEAGAGGLTTVGWTVPQAHTWAMAYVVLSPVGSPLSIEARFLWEVQPSAARLNIALQGTHGPVRIAYRYERRTVANQFLADVTPAVISAAIEGNNDRDIFRTARFAVDPSEAEINPLADHLAVFADVTVDRGAISTIQLGLFALTVPKKQLRPNLERWEVGANDPGIHLMEATTTSTYVMASGQNYITGTNGVKSILDTFGLRHALPTTTLTLPTDRSWPPGSPWLRVVNDLLGACNFYSLWFDREGIARSRTRDELAARTADFAYDGTGFILIPIDEEAETTRFANQVVAVVEDPNVGILRSVKTNTDPDSPTSTITLGRTITKVIRPKAADQTTLDAIAFSELQESASLYRRLSITTQPDPRRDAHEVLSLTVEGAYEPGLYWVRQWAMECKPGAAMRHVIAKVERVQAT